MHPKLKTHAGWVCIATHLTGIMSLGIPMRGIAAVDPETDAYATRAAGYASSAGSFLAGTASAAALADSARGSVTGYASADVQQWLSQFGTARVQINTDKHFSLKNSQLDLLVPFWEKEELLAFTQGSWHRTDDRTQANLGVGARRFNEDHMLGANLFLDYDVSRDHARAGFGLEYWRDFLKLSNNVYLRLTGWKDSKDFSDYEERPSNGWDVRAEGYLPAYPQLGVKLTYEQYYGDDVALFGKSNLQKDPMSVTAGLNYTPVPLVTFSAEQRTGKSGVSDTLLGLQLNYQWGTSWSQLLDGGAVAQRRSMAGSRYDLVERNNNIVLEYRKKVVIRMSTRDSITGKSGEKHSLGVSVTANHGLERIDWDAASLIAQGGSLVDEGGHQYSVLLPAYAPAGLSRSEVSNTHAISGVAYDRKGNASSRVQTLISVEATGEVDVTTSTFTASPASILADGAEAATLTFTAKDTAGNGITGLADTLTFVSDTGTGVAFGAVTESADGVYTATFSGTVAGSYTLSPQLNGTAVSGLSASVTLNAGEFSATTSTFTASPASILADGAEAATLTFTAKDTAGNGITGLADTLTFVSDTGTGVAFGAVTESADGVYTATFSGTVAGSYTLSPQLNGTAVSGLSASVTLNVGEVATLSITRSAEKAKVGETITLSITATDKGGNLVPNAELTLNTTSITDRQKISKSDSGSLQLSNQNITTNMNGTATVNVTEPNGIGVMTGIAITSGEVSEETTVIFTVLTSPDSDKANMYGHMAESYTTDLGTVQRPMIAAETSGYSSSNTENNEVWPIWTGTYSCSIASSGAMIRLANTHGLNLSTELGWPKDYVYRTSTDSMQSTNYQYAYFATNVASSAYYTVTASSRTYLVCM